LLSTKWNLPIIPRPANNPYYQKYFETTIVVYSSFPPERIDREMKTINAITWSYGPIKRGMVQKMYNGFLKR